MGAVGQAEARTQPAPPQALSAAAAPPAQAVKRRRRPRLLPEVVERRPVSLNISPCVDVKLEILAALDGKMKNELVIESLREFLDGDQLASDALYDHRPGKVRVTFILTHELDARLTSFVERCGCTTGCAVTAALAGYFKRRYRIDLLKNPSRERIIQALRA